MRASKTKDNNITELKLQQDCFIWHWNRKSDQRGRLFMIHNNPRNEIEGAKLKGAGMIQGIPDFLYLLHNGKYLFIEMKNESYQSIFQKWFEKIVNLMKGNYIVCRSLIQFQEIIKKYEGDKILLPVYPIAA